MDRILLTSLASTGLGLVVLGALAAAHETHPIPLDQVGRHEGQRVCVEAVLAHARTTASGGARMLLARDNVSLALWAPFLPAGVPGDEVMACGEVRLRGTGPELALSRPGDVRVTRSWSQVEVTVDRLARAPWEWCDRHVSVEADVRCVRMQCTLEDPRTGAAFPAAAGYLPGPQIVRGVVVYDPERASFRLRPEP